MKHHYSPVLNSGDINLTASLMSMGIPLDQDSPCSLVLRDNGRNYASFHVSGTSIKGDYKTKDLMYLWKNRDKCEILAFLTLMDFVTFGSSQGAIKPHEWLEVGFEFIKDMNEGQYFPFPKSLDLIPDMVAARPDALESYIMAFVYNRDHCWDLVKTVRRRRIMMTQGNNHGMVDSDLPRWQVNEILARMED